MTEQQEILTVLKALLAARSAICDSEMDGYGACRYCGSESFPVDGQGKRLHGEDAEAEAEEYHCEHKNGCPSAILDNAFSKLDKAMVYRVLAKARNEA